MRVYTPIEWKITRTAYAFLKRTGIRQMVAEDYCQCRTVGLMIDPAEDDGLDMTLVCDHGQSTEENPCPEEIVLGLIDDQVTIYHRDDPTS
tara:strand:- start:327 stop:599 length:273 start_codon:yes stop_codon:yes gene_type:complete